MKILLTLSLLTLCTFTAQETMQPTNKLEQHEWLQQLVGEWNLSSEAIMEPGGDPTTWESKESIRSIEDGREGGEGTRRSDHGTQLAHCSEDPGASPIRRLTI